MTIRPFLAGGARWANVALNVFTAIVAVGLLATFVKNQGTSQARSSAIPLEEPASTAIAVPLNADAWQGHRDAPVAMIEFSDFQCPYCGEYARTTYPELKRAFIDTGRLLYAFRNFPLDSVHPLAMPAAAIAACARNRGVLWQVHDGLFALKPLTQQGLDDLAFTNGLAADSGACAREAVLQQVLDERNDAVVLGVRSTPTFLIGHITPGASLVTFHSRILGNQPISVFRAELERVGRM